VPLNELQRPFTPEPVHHREHAPLPDAQYESLEIQVTNWESLWIDTGGEG
jgi:hypothetical protein